MRDYLETLRWDKQPPGPELPPDVVARTVEKYVEAFDRLRGEARWRRETAARGSRHRDGGPGHLFAEAKREFEKKFIARVLQRHRGNLSRAAKDLRIHRNTLGKKLEEYKIQA